MAKARFFRGDYTLALEDLKRAGDIKKRKIICYFFIYKHIFERTVKISEENHPDSWAQTKILRYLRAQGLQRIIFEYDLRGKYITNI